MTGRYSFLAGALCSALLLCGCDRGSPKSNAVPQGTGLFGSSSDFNLDGERRGRFFIRRISDLCNEISKIPDKAERSARLEKLARAIAGLKLNDYTPRERESMAGEFWLSLEYVAYHLVRNGSDERFVEDFMLGEFRKFRDMCLSCGDAGDYSDGWGAEARERRRIARSLHGSWKNGVAFWERHSIQTIFHGHPDAARRFRERWLGEFGDRKARETPPEP